MESALFRAGYYTKSAGISPRRNGRATGRGRAQTCRSDAFVDVEEAGLHEPVELLVRQLAHDREVVLHDRVERIAAGGALNGTDDLDDLAAQLLLDGVGEVLF